MTTANRFLAGLSLAVPLLVSAPNLLAMEQTTLNFWEIVACPSENIEMEGSVRLQTQSAGGADHATWVFQAFWTGDAWGLDTGTDYRLQGKWMEVVQENPPFVFLWNDHFELIGNGTAPNYRFYNKIRLIVDANGEISVDFADDAVPCPTIDFEIW
jgi:hypothetical protein